MLVQDNLQIEADNSLLILDDDEPFLKRLSKAMEKKRLQSFSCKYHGRIRSIT